MPPTTFTISTTPTALSPANDLYAAAMTASAVLAAFLGRLPEAELAEKGDCGYADGRCPDGCGCAQSWSRQCSSSIPGMDHADDGGFFAIELDCRASVQDAQPAGCTLRCCADGVPSRGRSDDPFDRQAPSALRGARACVPYPPRAGPRRVILIVASPADTHAGAWPLTSSAREAPGGMISG
jgi:hypothetical protein